jgi:zinc transporter 1/2/3
MVGEEEYQVSGPTATEEFQAEYTGCHTHGSET